MPVPRRGGEARRRGAPWPHDIVPFKADKSEMEHLEKRLMDKISESIDSIQGAFANKEETTRRFS